MQYAIATVQMRRFGPMWGKRLRSCSSMVIRPRNCFFFFVAGRARSLHVQGALTGPRGWLLADQFGPSLCWPAYALSSLSSQQNIWVLFRDVTPPETAYSVHTLTTLRNTRLFHHNSQCVTYRRNLPSS